jgi:cyclase
MKAGLRRTRFNTAKAGTQWIALLSAILAGVLGAAKLGSAQPSAVAPGDVRFEVHRVRPNIYLLANSLSNVTVLVGNKEGGAPGTLLVDTGSPRITSRILDELRKLNAGPVRFILNTSADADHTGANEAIAKPAVPERFFELGQIGIFAQDNVFTRMSQKNSGVAQAGWPTITFENQKDFVFHGEPVQIFAEGPAHTDGDSIVLFRNSNVLATGDIFMTTGYPVIDLQRGGSIQGELKALNHILEITVPEIMQEGGTLVIPGHGRLCDEADVTEYRDMVTIIRDRVADMLKKGKSLEEVKAARLSRDYDPRYSTASWTGEMFVESIYKSLSQRTAAGGER